MPRFHRVLLMGALVVALAFAIRETRRANAAFVAESAAVREVQAAEKALATAKRDATAAEASASVLQKAVAALPSQSASVRGLSPSALIRQQTTESLRRAPDFMAAAHEAAGRRTTRFYGPLIAKLHLTEDQAATFRALVLQRDGVAVNEYPVDVPTAGQKQAAEDALRQLLGSSGYDAYVEYGKVLPARVEVERFAASLSQVDPLSADVAEKLVQAQLTARERHVAENQGRGGFQFWPYEDMLVEGRTLLTARQYETLRLMAEESTGRKMDAP